MFYRACTSLHCSPFLTRASGDNYDVGPQPCGRNLGSGNPSYHPRSTPLAQRLLHGRTTSRGIGSLQPPDTRSKALMFSPAVVWLVLQTSNRAPALILSSPLQTRQHRKLRTPYPTAPPRRDCAGGLGARNGKTTKLSQLEHEKANRSNIPLQASEPRSMKPGVSRFKLTAKSPRRRHSRGINNKTVPAPSRSPS